MHPSSIPIGQTVTTDDNSNIKTTLTRISNDEGIMRHIDPATGRTVLEAKVSIHGESSELIGLDPRFWTITVDGKPLAPNTTLPSVIRNMKTSIASRTITILTR